MISASHLWISLYVELLKNCCCIDNVSKSNLLHLAQALGNYTKTIGDFTLFPAERREGKMGQYWYHDDTQAFFDDSDHYKMIKAMCRLSCSECDKEDQLDDGSRRRAKFRNIDQLKGHLFHKHRLIMCSLCLEGRKVQYISWSYFHSFNVFIVHRQDMLY